MLRPVSLLHATLIIVLLLQRHFLVTLPLAILWLLYGTIGQALHKDVSARQLAQGKHVTLSAGNEFDLLSPHDSRQLAKAILGLAFILSVSVVILAFHFGVRWFLAVPLGVIAWFTSAFLSMLLAGGDTFLKAWRKRRAGN